ncbi:MAG: lipoyl(octanoyl) transferase LipB [Chloroflexi bacterium]|nr:lipoyl(octanoyl) transferase LipB [Chloroflexota bacterium]
MTADLAPLRTIWLGRRSYRSTWALQRALADARRKGWQEDTLLLVEHEPTITLGRRAVPDHLLASSEELEALNLDVVAIDRGGDVTLHCPGQLVAYPILHLDRWGNDVIAYLRHLEDVGIRVAREFGVTSHRDAGFTGVWVGGNKLAAIGVRVSRGVTTHGIALNVDPDLKLFQTIVPCGLHDRGVTSLRELANPVPWLEQVREVFIQQFCAVFECEAVPSPSDSVDALAEFAPPEPAPSPLQIGLSLKRQAS